MTFQHSAGETITGLFDALTQVKWAEQQIYDFNVVLNNFITNNIYFIERDFDKERNEVFYKHASHPYMIRDFFPRIASIINSLYAALDFLAYKLVTTNPRKPSYDERWIYFPIRDTRNEFEKAMKSGQIKYARRGSKGILRSLKPYKSGNYGLWLLGELNNRVKHRELIKIEPRFFMYEGREPVLILPRKIPDIGDDHILNFREAFVAQPVPFNPLENYEKLLELNVSHKPGVEVYRERGNGSDMYQNFQFAVDITFSEPEIIKGKAVIPTLAQLASTVSGALEPFRALFT